MSSQKAASLVSSLLATKGGAAPATPAAPNDVLTQLFPLGARSDAHTVECESHWPNSESDYGRSAKSGASEGEKMKVSFRLSPNDHLRLKLVATHFHKSIRECVEEAIDFYLASCSPVVRKGGCACIAERGGPEK